MLRTFLLIVCLGLGALIFVDLAHRPARMAVAAPHRGDARPSAAPGPRAAPVPAAVSPAVVPGDQPATTASPAARLPVLPSETPTLDMMARLAVRRRLAREGDRVYIDSLLVHTDSVLTRWADRSVLTVALIPDTTLGGWSPALLDEARAGMQAWSANGAGIDFREVAPGDSADIVVHWVRALSDTGEVGLTSLSWTMDGVVHGVTIALALRRADSIDVPPAIRVRVAAHEFGHALGLPHSDSDDDLMFRTSPVDQPSQRDQATLRLLYAVPPGPLRIQLSQ